MDCPICHREMTTADLVEVVTRPAAETRTETEGQSQVMLRRHFKSSTKLRAIVTHLERLRKTDPDVKSVIFSQFTTMLDLCGTVMDDAGICFTRLDGSMNQKEREKDRKSVV